MEINYTEGKEIANTLGMVVMSTLEVRVRFREKNRIFGFLTCRPKTPKQEFKELILVTSDYAKSWAEIFLRHDYLKPKDQEHYQYILSLYLKACREGYFPCEADGHLGEILLASEPTEYVLLYPELKG